jgi:hypothetical protein
MRLLVTGSRRWTNTAVIWGVLDTEYAWWFPHRMRREQFIVVHGNARGADTIARLWTVARKSNILIDHEPHDADWTGLGRRAGAVRNTVMVKTHPDRYIGFPLCHHEPPTGSCCGTHNCVAKAEKAGIPGKEFSFIGKIVRMSA